MGSGMVGGLGPVPPQRPVSPVDGGSRQSDPPTRPSTFGMGEDWSAPTAARVLVVEDNPDHAEMVALMLRHARSAHWVVQQAGSLAEATECLGRRGADV